MAISHFHAHIIGGDRPVGQYLTRLLAEQDIIYKSVSFSSRERPLLQLQSQARPVFILTPSVFAAEDLDGVPFWLQLAREEDIPVLFLSTLSLLSAPDGEVVSEDWKEFNEDELNYRYRRLENQARENPQHLILRAGQIFSFSSDDYSGQILNSIRNEPELALDMNRFFEPTPADDVADVILAVLRQVNCSDSLWGTYHFSGAESLSSYAFAEAMLSEAGQYEDLSDTTLLSQENQFLPQIWTPVSDHSRLFHTFGIKPKPWRQGLSRLVRQYYRAES